MELSLTFSIYHLISTSVEELDRLQDLEQIIVVIGPGPKPCGDANRLLASLDDREAEELLVTRHKHPIGGRDQVVPRPGYFQSDARDIQMNLPVVLRLALTGDSC